MLLRLALVFAALVVGVGQGWACEVRLRHPSPNCPAVTYSPSDCQGGTFGRTGDKETVPASINMMSSGHAYYCASHEGCVPIENITINQCVLSYIPRDPAESPEYLGHVVVDTKPVH